MSENNQTIPHLTPIITDWIQKLVQDKTALKKIVDSYQSPIHIHNPDILAENAYLLSQPFKAAGIPFKLFFARKPNKCLAYIEAAKASQTGVDTASYNELKQTIKAGLKSNDILFTAAIKEKKALELAVSKKIMVIVDNHDELLQINELARQSNQSVAVGLRVSGFVVDGVKLYSRFGFDCDQLDSIFEKFIHKDFTHLTFAGFQFHLNGYSVKERAEAMFFLLRYIEKLRKNNITTSFLDIGGGIPVCYLQSRQQWETFESELIQALLGKRNPLTFMNDGLGYTVHEGEIIGNKKYYPYYNECYKHIFIKSLLEYLTPAGLIKDLVKSSGVEIRIEAGRSLLDQCGFTVARVAYRKQDSHGDYLVGLEMNMTQLMSSSADFLSDPIILNLSNEETTERPSNCYFVGAYCLERDVILKRKISLKRIPAIGDLVCFINTAGYMMHFFESRSHQFDLAKNVVYDSHTKKLDLHND